MIRSFLAVFVFAACSTTWGQNSPQEASVYIPVEPCRIIDTRNSAMGVMLANTSRDFFVQSSDNVLGNQGGADCPNPRAASGEQPVALAAYIVAVPAESSTGNGILSAYPSDLPPPARGAGATVNFNAGQIIGNTTIATLCNANETDCPDGGTLGILARDTDEHVVVDVQGYFFPRAGVPGYQLVSNGFAAANSSVAVGQVECPSDKKVLGGGATALDPNWFLDSSLPLNNGEGWQVRYRSNGQNFSVRGQTWAICASVD
ncbi:hypothetical protein [Candidatus Marimicrobium litorale]|uniref:Uncharacterized protein n=1 Tax=Candidatus Marimicrobium litorale TaxID=2518991 RepID=A0ABT3T350_9GAMM|nr:hypothetical protein [Candidatus Marimicrobium litorale]MCX2976690.1 hypothetical protein [Candidatus Marimicrobium litorale]